MKHLYFKTASGKFIKLLTILVFFVFSGYIQQVNAQTCAITEYLEITEGYAVSVFASNSIDGSGATSALGNPISPLNFARINADGDFLVLNLGQTVISGETVSVYWASDDGNQATLRVEQSTDGITYTNLQSFTTATLDPSYIISPYTLTADAQYVRFTRATGAQEPMIAGLIYNIYTCLSAVPVAVNDFVKTPVNTLININVQANDSDPQNLPLTTSIVSGPVNGTGAVQPNGTINYTPTTGYIGNDVIQYQICNTHNGGLCATATVNITVGSAELSISKTVNNAYPDEGQQRTFTLTVTNNGSNTATNVVVNDLLPAGVTHVSNTGAGSYTPANGIWNIANIADGASATLNITVAVNAGTLGTNIINSASITSLDQIDSNTSNNSSSVTLFVRRADLQVTKTTSTTTPTQLVNFTFTVSLRNNGPSAATDIILEDILHPDLEFVSATPQQGTYDAGTGKWTVGTLASGVTRTLAIVVRPKAGTGARTITNTASVFSVNEFDNVSTNNSATVTVRVKGADLAVTKTANVSQATAGDNIVYTIVVQNLGPDRSDAVVVTDILSPDLEFVSATHTQGTAYNPATGTWAAGNINALSSATFTLTAKVDRKSVV